MCKLLDRNVRAGELCSADCALNDSLRKTFFLACRFLDRNKLRSACHCFMLEDLDLDRLNFLAAYVAEECYFNFAVSLACSCAVADLDALCLRVLFILQRFISFLIKSEAFFCKLFLEFLVDVVNCGSRSSLLFTAELCLLSVLLAVAVRYDIIYDVLIADIALDCKLLLVDRAESLICLILELDALDCMMMCSDCLCRVEGDLMGCCISCYCILTFLMAVNQNELALIARNLVSRKLIN